MILESANFTKISRFSFIWHKSCIFCKSMGTSHIAKSTKIIFLIACEFGKFHPGKWYWTQITRNFSSVKCAKRNCFICFVNICNGNIFRNATKLDTNSHSAFNSFPTTFRINTIKILRQGIFIRKFGIFYFFWNWWYVTSDV